MKATKLYSAIDLHSNNLFVAIGDAQADALNMADYFAGSMRSRNSSSGSIPDCLSRRGKHLQLVLAGRWPGGPRLGQAC
jgi:hypothetical protein